MEQDTTRQRRKPGVNQPKPLSLPSIPPDAFADATSGRLPAMNRSYPSLSGSWADREIAPLDWIEDDELDAPVVRRRDVSHDPDSGEFIAITESVVIARPSVKARATAARARIPAPRRTMRRGLILQLLLIAAVLFAAVFAAVDSVTVPVGAVASAFSARVVGKQIPPKVTAQVPTFTQVDPTIGYDSSSQYNSFWGAACSAAATGEVLTAWGDSNAHIGQIIDDMGNNISPSDGLVNYEGFNVVAQKHHFNVVIQRGFSPTVLANLVGVQGIPVIVDVRADWNSYYGYFAGGHFLVVTGADANGFQIVDSSMYYIHYLTTATFMSLWDTDNRGVIIFTPPGYPVNLTS